MNNSPVVKVGEYSSPPFLQTVRGIRDGDIQYRAEVVKTSGRMNFVGLYDEIQALIERIDTQKIVGKPMSSKTIQMELRVILRARRKD